MNRTMDGFTKNERDVMLESLNIEQREFLSVFLRRGKRTVFSNILAREKAGQGSEANDDVVDNWELVDYVDAGPNWRAKGELFCECGRSLRYQYIVKNRMTGEIKKFGKSHFADHTGIPSNLAKKIINGMEEIDFELDEILIKVKENWSLADERIYGIDPEIELPKDIKGHLDCGLPLLNRQVRRLHQLIHEFTQEQQRKSYQTSSQQMGFENLHNEEDFVRVQSGEKESNYNSVTFPKEGIKDFLANLTGNEFNASNLCEYLVKYHGASSQRFSSGKLKIFPDVCMELKSLEGSGQLELVGKTNALDRIYRVMCKH